MSRQSSHDEESVALISNRAPAATEPGPLAVQSGEYKFAPAIQSDVMTEAMTELWAKVYAPKGSGKFPLLVFLHGNHGTCGTPDGSGFRSDSGTQYTSTGACPAGQVVVPNHLGYEYVAEKLAAHGYVIVSINANRGITAGAGTQSDNFFLIMERGRLILKHLEKLAKWNTNDSEVRSQLGFSLAGLLDFSHVGMMGHSRGGEGIRAAYNLYMDSGSPWPNQIGTPVVFEGLFEIGPVDGQAPRSLNAEGTNWAVLVPMCDGDVSDLQGVKPFDRMMVKSSALKNGQKLPFRAILSVHGANHNFYNTEWQSNDSGGCITKKPLWRVGDRQSAPQRETGIHLMMAFFRSMVGPKLKPELAYNLNPAFVASDAVETLATIDKDFVKANVEGEFLSLENFTPSFPNGMLGGTHSIQGATAENKSLSPHETSRKILVVKWESGSNPNLQLNWPALSVLKYKSLDISVSRTGSSLNTNEFTDFKIKALLPGGKISKEIKLSDFFKLRAPAGNTRILPILKTVRLPLAALGIKSGDMIAGLQLEFRETPQGEINLGQIRLGSAILPNQIDVLPLQVAGNSSGEMISHNLMKKRTATYTIATPLTFDSSGLEEVTISSQIPMPVTNSAPVLNWDGVTYTQGRFAADGRQLSITFQVKKSSNKVSLVQNAPSLRIGNTIYDLSER